MIGIDYYYIIRDEIRNIHPVYKPVKRYFWDRFLLKKDTEAYERELTKTVLQYQSTFGDTSLNTIRIAADSILIKQRKELNWSTLYFTE